METNSINKYYNLLDGQWVESISKKEITIYSPIDQSIVGTIPAMEEKDVDAAIANTKEKGGAWAKMPLFQRAEIFYKVAHLLEEKVDDLAVTLMNEVAKDYNSARSEILRTADFIRYTADVAKASEGQSLSGENFPGGSKNKMSFINRVPLGTVLAISPFNYPVNLSMSKLAPALIGGNTVVLKPATQGAISALRMVALFKEAGLPDGVLNTITGRGSDIGDYVVMHPGINFINFTGSSEVGRSIAQKAGMIPLLMELGGKDAAIVLEDADLDLAAKNIVSGAYSYSGQRCTAVKRILVMDKVADQLIEKLKPLIEKLKVGQPIDNCTITPLISKQAADFVEGLVLEAKEMGAKMIYDYRREDNLIYPVLMDNVTTAMRLAWEEPFGPVLPIIRVSSVEEAIKIANASDYGLQSSVFTRNINDAFMVANALEVGSVQVNGKTERGPDHFPFTGVKSSGLGTQGVKYSIEAMTRPKAIVVNL